MNTKIIKINKDFFNNEDLKEAVTILHDGGLVAFPTETVYGLGANGLDEDASKKIYAAKGRPSDNPLILHIADFEALTVLTKECSLQGRRLAETFWPGPLTLIFKKSDQVPYSITGGLESVAIRMPAHPVAYEMIRQSGLYIAAPSANKSGRPSPTKAEHVAEDLDGKIDMIIDCGKVEIGLESTIVDITGEIPVILRPGYITTEMLESVVGSVEYDSGILGIEQDVTIVPKAPGMKYKHYAPKGDLMILEGETENVVGAINFAVEKKISEGYKVGIIATDETYDRYHKGVIKTIGSRKDEGEIARNMFEILRGFDAEEVDYIYTESFKSGELGQAIMNRLLKAAGYKIEKV